MSEAEFHNVAVSHRQEETAHLTLLRLAPLPEALVGSHMHPGQYVAVRAPGVDKPGYLALASRPGAAALELLVRAGDGEFAKVMRGLVPGDVVAVSAPMGSGYPLAVARGRDLWLIGVGSGISALRSAVDLAAAEPAAFTGLHLLLGARGVADFPLGYDLAAWRAAGVEVILTVSRDPGDVGWDGERGYVQDVLRRRAPRLTDAHLFVCGMQPMIEAVRAIATELGLPTDCLHTNS